MATMYKCNPEKNTYCVKDSTCFLNGGPCHNTTIEEFGDGIDEEATKAWNDFLEACRNKKKEDTWNENH